MEIVLIQPPIGKTTYALEIPVGILTLATTLKKHHHNATIIDFNFLVKYKKITFNSSFFKRAAKMILSHNIDLLGFSCLCNNLPTTILIIKEIKRLNPKAKIILGGPEVTFESKELLEAFPEIDIIVRGEGELTVIELMEALEKKKALTNIAGLTFRNGNEILEAADRPFIKNLDSLPYLDFKLLPQIERYGGAAIEGGRGCPFGCIFCSTSQMWGHCFRIKSPQRLANEISFIRKLFRHTDLPVAIHHDHLLTNRKTANEFLKIITPKKIKWFCSSRLDALDEELIKDLKRAGCVNVYIGIETGSANLQKYINKKLDLSALPRLHKAFLENGLHASFSFIIGFPVERKQDLNQTLLCALQCGLYASSPGVRIHLLTPLKNSLLLNKMRDKYLASKAYFKDISPLVTNLPEESSIIKKYPHIFPSFYALKLRYLDYNLLHKICCLFNFLAEFFPVTSLLMLSISGFTPYQFAQKMILFFKQKGIKEWILPFDAQDLFKYYLPFFRKFISKNCSGVLRNIFEDEEKYQRAAFKNKTMKKLFFLSRHSNGDAPSFNAMIPD